MNSGKCTDEPMMIGEAIEEMKHGNRVQRRGWNGAGMFLFIVAGDSWDFQTDVSGVDDIGTQSFICMKTANNQLIPWLASQADLLANDWQIAL